MKPRRELSAQEIEELQSHLVSRLSGIGIPSLPNVAIRVLELTQDPNSSFNDFAEVVEADQAIAGKLIRMANSAFFAQSKPVCTIQRAMVLIGLQRLKALVLGFHLSGAASATEGVDVQRVWTQSIFRGWFAHGLAARVCRPMQGEAFIVGLLSDAGIPLMPALLGDAYAELDLAEADAHQRFVTEYEHLPFTHVDVAAALCQHWNIPEVLTTPIAAHHAPASKADPSSNPQMLRAIASALGRLELSADPDNADRITIRRSLTSVFELSPKEIEQTISEAAENFSAGAEIFSSLLDASLPVERMLERANEQLVRQIEELLEHERSFGPPPEILTAGDYCYEIRLVAPHRLEIVIYDSRGIPLLHEQLQPDGLNEYDLRSKLLLNAFDEESGAPVVETVRRLAA